MGSRNFGQLEEFNPRTDSWQAYVERANLYFQANGISEEKQLPVFLSSIGGKTYGLLRNLMAPTLPKDKPLDEVIAILKKHFDPKPAVIAERFKFHKRDQLPGESLADYIAELRRLATHCEFGEYLNDALRDRLVCGLHAEVTQRRLLTIKNLMLQEAIETALSMETAEKDSKALQGSKDSNIRQVSKIPAQTNWRQSRPCYRCGKANHHPSKCRFIGATCRTCGKTGHIAAVCNTGKGNKANPTKPPNQTTPSQRSKSTRAHYMETEEVSNSDELHLFAIGTSSKPKPLTCEVTVEGSPLVMEIDTGAEVSVISEGTRQAIFPELQPTKSNVLLKTYTNEVMSVVGELQVKVQYGEQTENLKLIVVSGRGPSLLGRDWMQKLRLHWQNIFHQISSPLTELSSLCTKYANIFKDELGTVSSHKAILQVNPEATPKFHKAHPVPFAIKEAVGAELDRLECEGILKKVDRSVWAAPIVAVPKKDGRFRICADYIVTVNRSLDIDQYPLPKPADLFATLAGGQMFTKLDLTQAYQQLLLDENSQQYTTINTHQGLYRYTRLPFGISSAPAIFQKTMDVILQGIPHVCCYIDDILITGVNQQEHLQNLEEVLRRLEQNNLRIKKSKCEFFKDSVEYLGHCVDAQGLHTLPSKVEAILKAPDPENLQQLRSFLGLLNYYEKFIPNLASIVHPLNQLLQKDAKWSWTPDCAQAFTAAKQALNSSTVLAHYDPSLPITLAGDASAYGIDSVISHTLPDGSEKPIAFASQTLSPSEKNYCQLEKEALSLVFGVKKFHQYLYGRKFTLITDHKPLLAILGPKKGIPPLAAARLQRWSILLSAYNYDIQFKSTSAHANADGLSHLPIADTTMQDQSVEVSLFNVAQINLLPVTAQQVDRLTKTDPCLSKVLQYTKQGWPSTVPEELKPYKQRADEITTEGDCLLWGIRVIIPEKLRGDVLKELHQNHPGVTCMKALARSYIWWPKLDKHLEDMVKSCTSCQSVKEAPPVAPLHPWIWPAKPWERIHVDFAGPYQNKMFLIVVDAHSKWPEVIQMASTSAEQTIIALRRLFATYGLPLQLVSDNGPQFTAVEFQHFLKGNGVKHIQCSPYHPSSNGLAERFVRTFKQAMKAGEGDGLPLLHRLQNFLLSYRATPHATTNKSPSSLFLFWPIRTLMDLIRPSCNEHVLRQQANQQLQHDKRARSRDFEVGETIMIRNYRGTPKWLTGIILKRCAPLTYQVKTDSGLIWRRHVDQLRAASPGIPSNSKNTESLFDVPPVVRDSSNPDDLVSAPAPPVSNPTFADRYPVRQRRPPDRYGIPSFSD